MEYATIPKVRGFVYAYVNQPYERVRTNGVVKYLKCSVTGCDGSVALWTHSYYGTPMQALNVSTYW